MNKRYGNPLKTVLVGCNTIAAVHLSALKGLEQFRVTALADIDADRCAALAQAHDVAEHYTDYQEMLDREKPDVAVVATPNNLHATMTLAAVRAGVRGVYCEKPMAVDLAGGRSMVQACKEGNVALVISHQRRLSPPLVRMREMIENGVIGQLQTIRGSCNGDLLTDGTHAVDTLRHINGDREAIWAFGQIHRIPKPGPTTKTSVQIAADGHRYGHPVETGAMALFEFDNGVRAELMTGDVVPAGSDYCAIEATGTDGRLWRPGDRAEVPLLVDKGEGWRPVPFDGTVVGPESGRRTVMECYRRFAGMILEGLPHPLSGESALKGLEILMGIFESARTHTKVSLPLRQERFPLQLMIDAGQL